MCTLTVFSFPDQRIVTMNRDERRLRTESGILRHSHKGSGLIVYPVDDAAGGTWMGVNSHGLCLCLTNRYQGSAPMASVRPSRGEIIPRLLALGDFASVHEAVLNEDFSAYPAFDLFLFSHSEGHRFNWEQAQLSYVELDSSAPLLHVSSAQGQEETLAYRQRCFSAFCKRPLPPADWATAIISDFHQCQEAGRSAHSVLMDREEARTQSTTQAILGQSKLHVTYCPRTSAGTFQPAKRRVLNLVPSSNDERGRKKRGRQGNVL